MYYVYIIKSIKNESSLYTGFTENIKNRLGEHNSGKSPHTSKYIPWKFIHISIFTDKKKALNFEKYLKTGSGIAFRNKRLIEK